MAAKAKRAPLRAVGPDEPRPRSRAKSVSEAAKGTPRELLVALRDRIARTVQDPQCPPRDLAALSRRLLEIRREIEQLDLADEQEAERGGPVEDESFDASAI